LFGCFSLVFVPAFRSCSLKWLKQEHADWQTFLASTFPVAGFNSQLHIKLVLVIECLHFLFSKGFLGMLGLVDLDLLRVSSKQSVILLPKGRNSDRLGNKN
jgi:hypothetical protein